MTKNLSEDTKQAEEVGERYARARRACFETLPSYTDEDEVMEAQNLALLAKHLLGDGPR